MKRIILLILSVWIAFYTFAQTYTGTVKDAKGEAIPFANVALYTLPDSAFVEGAVTNDLGNFKLKVKKQLITNCMLVISHTGYEKQTLQMYNLPRTKNFGTLMLKNHVIDEVTVKAEGVISKVDRVLIYPQKNVVENSNDGYSLLDNIMLADVQVNTIDKSISKAGGGNVAVYINDKKASKEDIVSLRPNEVLRIEHIDAPGSQYANDNIDAVINIIVKKPISGLVTGINTTNAITTKKGNNFFYLKYNRKASEIGINYSSNYGIMNNRYIDQNDTYILSDSTQHTIYRKGIDTYLKYVEHNIQLNYDFSISDKHIFKLNLRGTLYDSPNRGHKQKISETGQKSYFAFTHPTEKYHSPVVDLFYKVNLGKNQTLTSNIVGTIIDTKYGYSYEIFANSDFINPTKNYAYSTKGKKYSLIGEVRYNKSMGKINWSSGMKHKFGHTKNEYTNGNDFTNELRNTNTYLYTQISGKINKMNYAAGIGGSYQTYHQNDKDYNYWLLRPSLTLLYPIFKSMKIRYQVYVSPHIPQLGEMSNVRQQANQLEYQIGNPDLKPYWGLTNMLTLSFQKKRFYVKNTTGYTYDNEPILTIVDRKVDAEGNTFFEFTHDNQNYSTQIWNYTYVNYYIIPQKLKIQGGISYLYNNYEVDNDSYSRDRWWGMVRINFMMKKWNTGVSWNAPEKSFSGITTYNRPSRSSLYFNYKIKNVTIGANWSYFLSADDYKSGEEFSVNNSITKDLNVFIPELKNMVSFYFSWNLSKGRKYRGTRKTLNNSDNDSGILKIK